MNSLSAQQHSLPSKYFKQFDPSDKTIKRVVLLVRVSSREQEGHLNNQLVKLRLALREAGVEIVQEFTHTWSGKGPVWKKKLSENIEETAYLAVDAMIAVDLDRWMRHPDWWSNGEFSKLRPLICDLEEIYAMVAGRFSLMTLVHPDAAPEVIRSETIKAGKPGRPTKNWMKKKQAERWFELVVRMCPHFTLREISEKTGVPIPTIQSWLKRESGLPPYFRQHGGKGSEQ